MRRTLVTAAAVAVTAVGMPAAAAASDEFGHECTPSGPCVAVQNGINIRPAPYLDSYFPDRPVTTEGATYTTIDGETGDSYPVGTCGTQRETLGWTKITWGNGYAYIAAPCLGPA